MRSVATLVGVVVCLSTTGCAHRHPLLCCGQLSGVEAQEKYLKRHARQIRESIVAASAEGALLLLPDDLVAPPTVLPGRTAAEAARTHLDKLPSRTDRCLFAYHPGIALPPDPISCVRLRAEVAEFESLLKKQEEMTIALTELREHEKKLATEAAATMVATAFLSDQVLRLEKALAVLSEAYGDSMKVISKNNQEVAATRTSIAEGMEQVRRTLEEFKQKLDQIK